MIFLYFSSLFFIRTSTVIEKGKYDYSLSILKEKNYLDQIISFPDNSHQKIHITKKVYNGSISILNKSNIEITCSSEIAKINNMKLLIYGNPQIFFEDDCYFNYIEIYGSPIIKTSENANILINNTILYNHSYHFPLHSNYIIYSKNESKKVIKSTKYEDCSKIVFYLSNVVNVLCEGYKLYTLHYTSLSDYTFLSHYVDFINNSVNDEDAAVYLSIIISSLNLTNPVIANFNNFMNASIITSIGKILKSAGSSVSLSMDWDNYLKYDNHCPWTNKVYKPEYDFLENRFNDFVENFGWRKVCRDEVGSLYLPDDVEHKMIKISSAGSWIIIVSIIIFAVLIFILCCFIGYYKYKKIYE